MHITAVLTGLVLAVCLLPTDARLENQRASTDTEKRSWSIDWPKKRFDKVKKSMSELEDAMKEWEKPKTDCMDKNKHCMQLLKSASEDCTGYGECTGDAISRLALLIGPLKNIERDLKKKSSGKQAAKHLKTTLKNLKKLMRDSSKQCKKASARNDDSSSCQYTLTKRNDKRWKKCKRCLAKQKQGTSTIAVLLTEKLRETLLPPEEATQSSVVTTQSPADTVLAWAKDWPVGIFEPLRNFLSNLKEKQLKGLQMVEGDKMRENKHCKKMFQKLDYCCEGYTDCKTEVASRLILFKKSFEAVKMRMNMREARDAVIRALQDAVNNVTDQCKKKLRGDSDTTKTCELKKERGCSGAIRRELKKNSNQDRVSEILLLLTEELESFLKTINVTESEMLAVASKPCSSHGKRHRGKGRRKTRGGRKQKKKGGDKDGKKDEEEGGRKRGKKRRRKQP